MSQTKSGGSSDKSSSRGSPIQSVERAARILSFFSTSRPRLTLAEITSRLSVSRATAHRYAVALRRANLLRYEPSTGEYSLGPQVLTLGAAAVAALPIVKIAGPLMEELVRDLNETVVMSVWDGEAPVIVRVEDNTERLVRISIQTGARLPVYTSAQGRVFSALLSGAEDLEVPEEMEEDFEEIRRTSLAVSSNVIHGIRAVAAPVFQRQELVATLAVVGTTASIPEEVDSKVALAVKETAKRISTELGFALPEDV